MDSESSDSLGNAVPLDFGSKPLGEGPGSHQASGNRHQEPPAVGDEASGCGEAV